MCNKVVVGILNFLSKCARRSCRLSMVVSLFVVIVHVDVCVVVVSSH